MAKGVVVTPTGTVKIVAIGENPHSTTLADLQACVGGLIEPVYLDGGAVMYLNEEGLLRGFWPNAWAIAYATKNSALKHTEFYLVGTVVVVGDEDEEGNVSDAPAELLQWAEKIVAAQDAD